MRFSCLALLLALFDSICAPAAASFEPSAVGQILSVTGRVTVRRGNRAPMRASLCLPLHAGDLLTVAPGGTVQVVLYGSGARFSLGGRSAARVAAGLLKRHEGPPPQPLPGAPMPAAGRSLGGRFQGSVVRASDSADGPREPLPIGALREGPVRLRWEGPVTGRKLQLRIRDARGRVAHSKDLPSTAREYAVPPEVLTAGEIYDWHVTAVDANGDETGHCAAWVRVLTEDERAQLGRFEPEIETERTASPDDPAPLLLAGVVYERLGLIADARAAYREALKLRPKDPGLTAAVKRLGD